MAEEPAKESAAEQPAAEPAPPRAADAPGAAGVDEENLHEELRENARYVNYQYFSGSVNAEGATFGSSFGAGSARAGSATGPVRAEDVERALRHYVKPTPFGRARRLLLERRVVVLCGSDGIGRYAGALALLREVGAPGLPTNLSPALTFAELAAQKFGNASGYVVRDQLRDANATAVQQFEVHRLLGAVQGRSYLVITTDLGVRPRGQLADLMVDWAAPNPDELFDRCVADLPSAVTSGPIADRVRQALRRMSSPDEIVRLAGLMAAGADAALSALDDSLRDRVTRWFDQPRTPQEVLTVAALAFVEGTPESVFERLLARLAELHRTTSGIPLGPTTPASGDDARAMPQSRRWDGADSLIAVDRAGNDSETNGERSARFTGAGIRDLVMAQLHERYGYELWEPVRSWLDELAAMPPSRLHVRLGLGMALYSRCGFREVEQGFLDRWSNGLAAERLAAACTLSWIGLDGTHAAAALGITKRWAQNSGPRRAVTAASALGGPLGLHYSSDALRWLWTLAMRTAQIRQIACVALGLLFAAAAQDPDATRRVLNFLHSRVRRAIAAGESQRDRRAVFDTVLSVLTARTPDTNQPVAAAVLREHPRNAARLGALWAELLCSGPHRRRARTALLEALEPLAGDPDALPAVQRLGAAVRSVLGPEQWEQVQDGLELEAGQRAGAGAGDEGLFTGVLAELRGRPVAHSVRHHLIGRMR